MRSIGQATGPSSGAKGLRLDDAGFVMVALLVSIAVTAVWMTALLPTWRQQVQREKEAELIFRGEAIARAIYLYRQKNGQSLPPSLDVLVSQRFLRKKYLDPISGKEFVPAAGATGTAPGTGSFGTLQGGIIGVRSPSNEASIRIYNNQQIYSLWAFDFTLEQLRAGGGAALGPIPPRGDDGRQGGVDGRGRGVGPGGPGGGRGGGRGLGPQDPTGRGRFGTPGPQRGGGAPGGAGGRRGGG